MSGDAAAPSTSPAYDALVVLGAGFRADGRVSPALERRARHAAALYHAGKAPWLVLSGGINPPTAPRSEAEAMAEVVQAAQVPGTCLVLEPASRNTDDNARLTAEILRGRGWPRIGLVTDRAHMRRARLAFRAHGVDASPEAVPGGPVRPLLRVREAAAYALYFWRYRRAKR